MNAEKTSNTFTLQSPHKTLIVEKTTKLLTPHPMTFIHQTKHYHVMRTKLSQLRANKSPLLQSYLLIVNHKTYMPQCSLRLSHTHETNHLFNCCKVPTPHY